MFYAGIANKLCVSIIIIAIIVQGVVICRPLNILFVVGHFPAPSQTFILNLMTGLSDRGHTITIFSFHKDDVLHVHPDIKRYDLMKKVIYKKFPKILPQCDIVFCQFGYLGSKIFRMPKLSRWLTDKKVVTCLRGSDITTKIAKDPERYKKLFIKGDLFLPVCDYFKQLLIKRRCQAKKIIVHHSAIDCLQFSFKKRKCPKDGQVNIISVCRLVEKKGIKYAIEAVAQVIKKYPHVCYTIVGDGPEHDSLAQLIEKLNMQDNIHLSGWKNQEEVVAMLDQSHIFILPSVTAHDGNEEGIPNALKEAMAVGLPVIATWHAGNQELIEDGKSGFLVNQKDPIALANTIIYLIEHAEKWPSIAAEARKAVVEGFEKSKNIDQLEKIFYQLVG